MDFILKQRLVGAVVLVALGVIFIPMLLEGPDRNLVPEMQPLPEPQERRFSQPLNSFPAPGAIPEAPDEQVVQADAPPLPAEQVRDGQSAQPEASLEEQKLVLPEPVEAEPEPEPLSSLADTAVKTPPAEPGPLGHWVVQVGSFSSKANALRLRDKLRGGGFATQVEKVVLADKAHYRVRVGPYLQRTEAEREAEKLSKAFDLKGRVLSYP